jgi:hypothetical protein
VGGAVGPVVVVVVVVVVGRGGDFLGGKWTEKTTFKKISGGQVSMHARNHYGVTKLARRAVSGRILFVRQTNLMAWIVWKKSIQPNQ